ncbi:AlpA family transcriptional regulator [Pseudomonas sp. WS 5071]|uniref:AlpA family transcriptional regulator n=1 Tax=Pseudomonas sp. WS 5071 TaxID=2717479 RepID=UPI0014734EEC|nr:AlpA family transcriptional regulator [Pseudomonas sp. WS 5071]NMY76593.1 AlpA family phage regulatory protein [Pseudomonas sp. WS 5071]
MPQPQRVFQGRRILRLPDVEDYVGFKRAHIYSLMSQGLFPHSVRLGPRAVGWDSLAIEKWIDDRISGEPSRRLDSDGDNL